MAGVLGSLLPTMPSSGLGGCCTSLCRLFACRKRISCRPHHEREVHLFSASVSILDKKQQKQFNDIFLPDSPDSSQTSPLCSLDSGNKHHDEMMHTTMPDGVCSIHNISRIQKQLAYNLFQTQPICKLFHENLHQEKCKLRYSCDQCYWFQTW